jgi:hypothetical protein
MVPKRDDPTENIFVFFPDEEKVAGAYTRSLLSST